MRSGRALAGRPVPHRAEVLTTPDSTSDPVTVRLLSEPRHSRTQIRYWMPRGEDLPAEGDIALVVVDDEGHLWIIGWMP